MDKDVFYSSAIPARGQVLLGTAIAFGAASFIVVTMRLVFRASQRKIGISDWCIGIAMVCFFTQCRLVSLRLCLWALPWLVQSKQRTSR